MKMGYTFKGYSGEELLNSDGKKFIGKIGNDYVEGVVIVRDGGVYLLSNHIELNGMNGYARHMEYLYDWCIFAGIENEYDYFGEELFATFAITKEVIKLEKDWSIEVIRHKDKSISIVCSNGMTLCDINEYGITTYSSADPALVDGFLKVTTMFDEETHRINVRNV